MRRDSILEELRAREISSCPGRYLLKRMLKLSNAGVDNRWIEREEKLCVISIKVVVQGRVLREAV